MSKAILRQVKNIANGYSTAQVMVRNATSNEPYGPSTAEMRDVANHTYENSEFLEVMDMVDKRLNDKGKNWRHVAKALTLLDFLVRYGSENVVFWSKDNLYVIKTLREFQYTDDASGQDHGAIIRVKAKELTALLMDAERLAAERAAARESRKRRGGGRDSNEDNEYDDDLQAALEASRMTAEEEENRRKADNGSSDSLKRALQLSLEEEELRKSRQQDPNLLDLSDAQPQGVLVGYDMYGAPIYQNAMTTGYLANAYQQQPTGYDAYQQQLLAQQQQQAQQAQQQALLQQQYEQQQAYLQQQYQQQLLAQQQQQQALAQQQYQQQLLAQQQQQAQAAQVPLKTGSNNPFAMGNDSAQSEPAQAPQQAPAVRPQTTGSQLKNEQFSELNNLLASGTGIDTFGNTGAQRIPAQHTKTQNFINSAGTGFKTGYGPNSSNPFIDTQYTGVPSTGIIPAYTGYGFGNAQPPQSQQQPGNGTAGGDNKLIDI